MATTGERLATLEQQIRDVHEDVHDLRDRLKEILRKLEDVSGRPSWSVTFLLGGLMSLVVGLAMAVLTSSA